MDSEDPEFQSRRQRDRAGPAFAKDLQALRQRIADELAR
jgi:hypothetical protein